jgi:hypothetical protein
MPALDGVILAGIGACLVAALLNMIRSGLRNGFVYNRGLRDRMMDPSGFWTTIFIYAFGLFIGAAFIAGGILKMFV